MVDRTWKLVVRAAVASTAMALAGAAVIVTGPTAGATSVVRSRGNHELTPNPTLGSAGKLHGAVYAWSNGLTVDYTGAPAGPAEQLIYYGSGDSTQKVLDAITCEGPDYSVFIPLPAGEWTGNATLIDSSVFSSSFPAFDFALEVGAKGSRSAPPATCQSPPPSAGFVDQPVVGGAATPDSRGYWVVGSDGSVQGFGDAVWYGDTSDQPLNAPVVGIASTPDGNGYWLIAQDGGVFSFGDAQFYGSTGSLQLNQPVVGMASTPDGKGYWLVAADGGVFSYGDARFYGSTGGVHLNQPVIGMAVTRDGRGYYLDASDGGVFAFGDARYRGSMGGTPINQPVVGMSIDPKTGGYWEVAADGGVFSFDAPFFGSAGSLPLAEPVVGMTNTPTGDGYRLIAADGGIFAYGHARFYGSASNLGDGGSVTILGSTSIAVSASAP